MSNVQDSAWIDQQVRLQVYTHFITAGHAPKIEEVARALSHSLLVVQAAYRRLAAAKALVLQASGEVLMAEPFSAVPTAFVVEVGSRMWWGNCIWDALGIAAMLKEKARVITACGCCGEEMTLDVRDGALLKAPESSILPFLPETGGGMSCSPERRSYSSGRKSMWIAGVSSGGYHTEQSSRWSSNGDWHKPGMKIA